MVVNNDSGVLEEIRTLLSEDRSISTKTALKLSLRLQVKMYGQLTNQGKDIIDATKRLEEVERASIVMWAQAHPKLTLFFASILLITGTLIDLRVVIAKALGIDP